MKSINLWYNIEPKDNILFAKPFAKGYIDDPKNAIFE
jgi:hypothetical protein